MTQEEIRLSLDLSFGGGGGSGDSPFCAPGEPFAALSISERGLVALVIIQTEELELDIFESSLIVPL